MANELLNKINLIVKQLVRLEIVTMVGPVTLTVAADNTIKYTIPADSTVRSMITRIDLVAGDIQNVIHPDFISGDLASMRDFHTTQVTKGHDVIVNNIKALRELAETLGDKLTS